MCQKLKYLISTILFCFLSSSCQSHVNIHMDASNSLNPDIRKHIAEPVGLSIFQLKEKQKFTQASYFSLIDEPSQILDKDYIDPVINIMISPSESKDIKIKLNPETKYIGIVAAFESIESARWKQIILLEGSHKKNITLKLENRMLKLN